MVISTTRTADMEPILVVLMLETGSTAVGGSIDWLVIGEWAEVVCLWFGGILLGDSRVSVRSRVRLNLPSSEQQMARQRQQVFIHYTNLGHHNR